MFVVGCVLCVVCCFCVLIVVCGLSCVVVGLLFVVCGLWLAARGIRSLFVVCCLLDVVVC